MSAIQIHVLIISALAIFFHTIQVSLPTYINSSFLSQFVPETAVGLIFTISSVLSILCFFVYEKLITRIGNRKITALLSIALFIAFSVLAVAPSGTAVILAFIAVMVIGIFLGLSFDVFLESISNNEQTGKIRGWFLTAANTGWVVGPFLAAMILTNGDYWKLYALAAALGIPMAGLMYYGFRHFADPAYPVFSLHKVTDTLRGNKNLQIIFGTVFLLQFFFSWMVIYTPIYLHEHIGFGWDVLGVVFAITLLPFVLLEAPLGKLADKKYGEKEMLIIGFVIMSIFTALMYFYTGNNLSIWLGLLVMTRIGAAIIEIMSETYFFKVTDVKDVDVLGIYRMTRPVAYIASPIIASFFLLFLPMKALFLILGIIVLFGVKLLAPLVDTK